MGAARGARRQAGARARAVSKGRVGGPPLRRRGPRLSGLGRPGEPRGAIPLFFGPFCFCLLKGRLGGSPLSRRGTRLSGLGRGREPRGKNSAVFFRFSFRYFRFFLHRRGARLSGLGRAREPRGANSAFFSDFFFPADAGRVFQAWGVIESREARFSFFFVLIFLMRYEPDV